ncbi:hypothetical protein PUV47_15635 [Pseudovibrio exalbescens]|uniref:hypothetical protein n=1 Tax=Pseudovibrio exalbescens TaxID=197461 RepID=UPI0023668944|nr:hypothetical protein [Pseudovibrio exalbescens]MDD7911362.1 hypothetical protein [Pseudovibrio exalbescens]
MHTELYDIRPLAERSPVHASLEHEHVNALVSSLVELLEDHSSLKERLAEVSGGDWSDHVYRMTQFWKTALLRCQSYTGRPAYLFSNKAHLFQQDDLDQYKALFRTACAKTIPLPAQAAVVKVADTVADSLSQAMFGTPRTMAA